MIAYHLVDNLLETMVHLHAFDEPEEVWGHVLQKCCEVSRAEAGTYFRVDWRTRSLRPAAVHGAFAEKIRGLSFSVDKGICGWVANQKRSALVTRPDRDPRFFRQVDLATGFRTSSLLCVPVLDGQNATGVVELMNRQGLPFSHHDQDFVETLVRQAGALAALLDRLGHGVQA